MLRLGATEETAKTAIVVPSTAATPAKARLLVDASNLTVQVDDGFDRAWRRVGVALDRSGFTVEDRDRAQGIYFVRYIDPATAGKDEPNFLSKFFSSKKDNAPARYRVVVKGEAQRSQVTVQNDQGAAENGEAGKRITALLVEELK
jgi:outer membrane protein assembly factor BamC